MGWRGRGLTAMIPTDAPTILCHHPGAAMTQHLRRIALILLAGAAMPTLAGLGVAQAATDAPSVVGVDAAAPTPASVGMAAPARRIRAIRLRCCVIAAPG